MKIKCPTCKQIIKSDQINMSSDLAFCEPCNEAFKISETIGKEAPDESILQNPPKGAWIRDEANTIVAGATTRSPIALFLVPFMCVWSGGSLGGIYGSQIINGKFDLFQSLFGIPFLLGTLFFGSIALMSVCGKVEVSIGQNSFVFTGVGPIGWRRYFNWMDIQSVREGFGLTSNNGRAQKAICLEGKKKLKFGTGLTSERRSFLLGVLKYVHAKTGA